MVHGAACGAKVFSTKCWYCGQRIFIFTCQCECCVFFDDLGAPWPKHLCAQYLVHHFGFSEQQVDSLVRRRANELGPRIDGLFEKAIVGKKEWDAPIERIMPSGNRRIIGVLRERVLSLDPRRKLGVASGTVQDRQLSRRIPSKVVQLTVHAGAIGAMRTESFTFWITSPVKESELMIGRLVEAELETLVVPGCEPVWLAAKTKLYENPYRASSHIVPRSTV